MINIFRTYLERFNRPTWQEKLIKHTCQSSSRIIVCQVVNVTYHCFQTCTRIEVYSNTSLASEAAFFSVIWQKKNNLDNDVSC